MRPRYVVLALASCLLFASLSAPVNVRAQWRATGAPISTAAGDQLNPAIASDGAGGAIMVWRDTRAGGNNDIYVQRVNAAGVVQWTADGVAVSTDPGDDQIPGIVSDGAGGAIVSWHANRGVSGYDIYVQHVNAAGAMTWPANGVALCTALNSQLYPTMVADGSGGAIVTWQDLRSNTTYDVYAQRVSSVGIPQWTANGVLVSAAANDQAVPTITSDGAGGAIIAWQDYRTGTSDDYAQRINSSGVAQWAANGVVVCNAANTQYAPAMVPDGAGGAIMTWEDSRSAADDIYAQRVNASGVMQWSTNGNAVCTAASGQVGPVLVADGTGGFIIAWYDIRSGTYDIYAQRVTAAGVAQWTLNGVALCTAAQYQYSPTIASDGSGGAIVTWYDTRNGVNVDVYAQRVNNDGAPQWTTDGMPLSTAAGDQYVPVIVADGSGGAIVAWYDSRSGVNDIYAQRVDGRYGFWGHPEPNITSVADVRQDQGGKVKVNWKASDWDAINLRTIDHYSVWRATDVAAMQSAGPDAGIVADPSRVAADFKGKAFWIQHAPATNYYWEWVGNQDAKYLSAYSFATDTRADSTIQGTAQHYFMVFSHTADNYTFWPSNIVSGHSVDNLAPAPPLFLTALRAGADVHLKWNSVHVPDLKQYAVYRATSTGVTPVPLNFLANDTDTVLVDAGAPASALYYIVTAYDVHQNQGQPSNEASVAATTGIGDLPPVTALTVLQNRPNPFTTSSELEVGLPKASQISVEVYDVAGRRVRNVEMTGVKGWQKVPLSARDDRGQALASGVYFYRVHAAGTTITRKMVIAR